MFSFFDVCGCKFGKVDKRFADGGVGVVEIVVKFGELFGVEADGMNADLEKTGNDGFDTVVNFGGSFGVGVVIDADDGLDFGFLEGGKKVFGLGEHAFHFG